jgi:hemolysin III
LGVIIGIIALVMMVYKVVNSDNSDPLVLASVIIFGISIILEYFDSTLYHALTAPRAKKVFKILDHCSIYLLIAGTYTPFCLIPLLNSGGLVILAIVWGLALVGVAAEAFWVFRPRWLAAVIYLAMGWMIVFKAPDLIAATSMDALVLLVAGGLCYTVGIIFYLLKKVPYMHSIWHLWTLAGSVCHFLAVLLFVL